MIEIVPQNLKQLLFVLFLVGLTPIVGYVLIRIFSYAIFKSWHQVKKKEGEHSNG